jgi:hypothetical protein
MDYGSLVAMIYQELQPQGDIEKLPLKIYDCKDELPDADGEYLVFHSTYRWCTYGYTVKNRWGCDDEVTLKNGKKYNKVQRWAKLDFLQANSSVILI